MRAIKTAYPSARVVFVGVGRFKEVLAHNPDVDELIEYKGIFSTLRQLRRENVDAAVLGNAGSVDGLALLLLTGSPIVTAFSTESSGPLYAALSRFVHATTFIKGTYVPVLYLRLLDPIGANGGDVHFRLYFSEEGRHVVESTLRSRGIEPKTDFLVAMAPGGSTPERWWPAERFAAVANMLAQSHDAKICILGAGNDVEPISRMIAALHPNVRYANFIDQPIDEFKATIALSSLVVGNDSGPMVTADAFDRPNLVLVGPTDWREYHRKAERSRVLSASSRIISDIPVQLVLHELEDLIEGARVSRQPDDVA